MKSLLKKPGRPVKIETSLPILDAIQQFQVQHGYAPSTRDLSDMVELAPSNVLYHLEKLERLGYIRRDQHISRSIVVLKRDEREDHAQTGQQ